MTRRKIFLTTVVRFSKASGAIIVTPVLDKVELAADADAGTDGLLEGVQDRVGHQFDAIISDEPIVHIQTEEIDDEQLQQLGLQKI